MKSLKKFALIVVAFVTCVVAKVFINRLNLEYENGRYFDQVRGIVLHEQAIIGYGTLLGVGVVSTLILAFNLRKKRSPQ